MCPSSPFANHRMNGYHFPEQEVKQTAGIPLPSSHIHRTDSELQLSEGMVVAELRDRCMFNRLVSGIREKQQRHCNLQRQHCTQGSRANRRRSAVVPWDDDYVQTAERSIEKIIRTRRQPDSLRSSDMVLHSVSGEEFSSIQNPSQDMTDVSLETRGQLDLNDNISIENEDWSIEGFVNRPSDDSSNVVTSFVASEMVTPTESDHDDHVFHIEM